MKTSGWKETNSSEEGGQTPVKGENATRCNGRIIHVVSVKDLGYKFSYKQKTHSQQFKQERSLLKDIKALSKSPGGSETQAWKSGGQNKAQTKAQTTGVSQQGPHASASSLESRAQLTLLLPLPAGITINTLLRKRILRGWLLHVANL